ncbi:MAG: NAD(P)-dependent oxidoreductase [Chitinophagales bacterium]
MLKIGLIKEGKTPADTRVALNPKQAKAAVEMGFDIAVQSSDSRCFSDEEYKNEGLPIVPDMDDRDILIGIKEVPIDKLIANKTYFFFSHTIKAQPYNQKLLQAVAEKNIRLIDYEVLTDENGQRIIAFGRWAGIVGALNGLRAYGLRTQSFEINPVNSFKDYEAVKKALEGLKFPAFKIAISGGGRVAKGAMEILDFLGIKKVSPEAFTSEEFNEAVYAQLDSEDLFERKDGNSFELKDFFANPEKYKSRFHQYYPHSDLFINAIYWDPKAPAFFTREDMLKDNFRISTIADITCDIAPEASVPSTIRPSTIDAPFYGFDPKTNEERDAFDKENISVMAVDNLPNELPRDASTAFGEKMLREILPELKKADSKILDRATIVKKGKLNTPFLYLKDYLES